MSIELWMGEEYEYTHEMRALGAFVETMTRTYGEDEAQYLIAANFLVDNNPVDLAVIKSNAIIIIELKEADGPVTGAENGAWRVTGRDGKIVDLKGGRHGNPYLQARQYRYALIDFLTRNQGRFLDRRPGREIALDHVNAFICLAPSISPDSQIELPKVPWLQVVGLDRLHLAVYAARSSKIRLTPQEMRKLVQDALHLKPVEASRYIPSQVLPETATTRLVSDQPDVGASAALAVAVETIAAPLPGQAPTQADVMAPGDNCFICELAEARCQVAHVRGTILGLKETGAHFEVLLDAADLEPVMLRLEAPWTQLARDILSAKLSVKSTTLAAFHLMRETQGLVAGPESLVVLEPDWLINVTDLTQVEYCDRQLILDRYIPSPSNEAMIRGNVVHQLFPEIWAQTPDIQFADHKRRAMEAQTESLIIAGADPVQIAAAVDPHLSRLKDWAKNATRTTELRSETFILSPRLGLKGKIDALWERGGRPLILGELKTGKSQGGQPKPGHAMQVGAYALMLLSRGEIRMSELHPLLLYSGNDQLGTDGRNVLRRIPLDVKALSAIVIVRNQLVLIDHTGNASFETNPNKCASCARGQSCAKLAVLEDHADPRVFPSLKRLGHEGAKFGAAEKQFFQHYARLLTEELRATKAAYAALWRRSDTERQEAGRAMRVGLVSARDRNSGGRFLYELAAAGGRNASELRRGDTVLVSGPEGPASGRVALGTVMDTFSGGLSLVTQEELRFDPGWVDAYTDENLTERLLSGLYLWMMEPTRLRDLLVHGLEPVFDKCAPAYTVPIISGEQPAALNSGQLEALDMSLRAQDYLLVLGPPGSGKTTLIQAMVRAHLALGHRVLISAGTNRAVDEGLKRLIGTELSGEVLRLGNEASTSAELQPYTLTSAMGQSASLGQRVQAGREALLKRRVVGATTSTLLSGKYDAVLGKFDVAIVDEAAQLTVPGTLGALRLARRFILIGDDNQLPPVVQSERPRRVDAGQRRTSDALSSLSVSLFCLLRDRAESSSWKSLVKLKDQYRMNETVCAIPSKLWYDSELKPANNRVARGRLQVLNYRADHELHNVISPDQPVKFIDVPLDASGGARTNTLEARWVRRLVRAYSELGLALGSIGGGQKGQIAVIAPFRAQVALIRRQLEEEFEDDPGKRASVRGFVDTVDRFQGSERDLVIFSLATADGKVHELLRDERRLNVAITRAQHKLIILGNRQTLMTDPTYYSLLQTIEETVGYRDWLVDGSRVVRSESGTQGSPLIASSTLGHA